MLSIHAGIIFVEQTVGPSSTGSVPDKALPVIIALHGLGELPEQYVYLLRTLPLRAHVAAARGFRPFSQGYGWLPPNLLHPVAPVGGGGRAAPAGGQ